MLHTVGGQNEREKDNNVSKGGMEFTIPNIKWIVGNYGGISDILSDTECAFVVGICWRNPNGIKNI